MQSETSEFSSIAPLLGVWSNYWRKGLEYDWDFSAQVHFESLIFFEATLYAVAGI